MIDDALMALLELLRCPESGQGLRLATGAELAAFPGVHPEGGLLTLDGNRLYPVRNGLPHLVDSEAVFRKGAEEAATGWQKKTTANDDRSSQGEGCAET